MPASSTILIPLNGPLRSAIAGSWPAPTTMVKPAGVLRQAGAVPSARASFAATTADAIGGNGGAASLNGSGGKGGSAWMRP